MHYIRTELATDFPNAAEEPWWMRLLAMLEANPNYRGKLHLVRSWLIEFHEEGYPTREIAVDAQGAVLFAGPSKDDHGYWIDTNMRLEDCPGEPVTQEHFAQMWARSGVIEK